MGAHTSRQIAKLEKLGRLPANSILAFLNKRCVPTKDYRPKWLYRDFYKEYEDFCADEGFIPVGKKKMIPQLKDMWIIIERGPKSLTYVYEWRLKTPDEIANDIAKREKMRQFLNELHGDSHGESYPRQKRKRSLVRPQITDSGGRKPLIEDSFEIGPDGKKIYTHPDHPKAKDDDYEKRIKSLKKKYPDSDPIFDILAHIQDMASDKPHEQSQDEWDSTLKLIIETLEPVLDDIYASPKDKKKQEEELKDLVGEFINAYLSVNPK